MLDSLHESLRNKAGGDRYASLYQLAVEHVDFNNELALQFVEQAEQAALCGADSAAITRCLRAKGQILFKLERIEELISTALRALSLAERNKFFVEYILIANVLANGYLYQSRFDKALEYYFLAQERVVTERDEALTGMVLGNIGITYYKLKDYGKARHYLIESRAIKKAAGTLGFDTPMNLSLCYSHLREYDKARKLLDESVRICGTACSDQSMTHIKYASGCIALGLGDLGKARAELMESYHFARGTGDSRMQLDNIYFLADILINENRFEEARSYLREGKEIVAQGVSFHLEMIKLYSAFSDLYISMKDFPKASFYQSKYIALKDSIYNEGLMTNLMKIESQFLERENEQKLAAQKEIIILKEHIIGRQHRLNIVTTILAIISVLFLVFLFRNYIRNRNLNHLLDQKIRERTLELEANRNSLIKSLTLRDVFVANAMEEISQVSHTIEGLCYTGIRDVADVSAHGYLREIDKATARLSESLQSRYRNQLMTL